MTLEQLVPSRSTSTSGPEATVTNRPFRIHGHWHIHGQTRLFPPTVEVRMPGEGVANLLRASSDTWIVLLLDLAVPRDEHGEGLVRALRKGETLRRSDGLRALARRALLANRAPEDLEAWARQLAEDTADATD